MPFVLELLEKLFALAGSVALALPFLRDQRLGWFLDRIKRAEPADEGAAEAQRDAEALVAALKQQFKPEDWRDGVIGVGCLLVSFLIGLVAVLVG
jgi:hypothetical protein